jgi:hypothetical protein
VLSRQKYFQVRKLCNKIATDVQHIKKAKIGDIIFLDIGLFLLKIQGRHLMYDFLTPLHTKIPYLLLNVALDILI